MTTQTASTVQGKNQNTTLTNFPTSIETASTRIAPVWPLDTAIAVNPWWTLRDQPFAAVSAKLNTLGNAQCLMPKDFYLQHWGTTIKREHLKSAIDLFNAQLTPSLDYNVEDLVKELKAPSSESSSESSSDKGPGNWLNLSDLLDAGDRAKQKRTVTWHDEITQQISQFCGLYFQHSEKISLHNDTNAIDDLYKTWLEVASKDKGIEVLTGEKGLHKQFLNLPQCPKALCFNIEALFGNPDTFADYAHSLLLDIHGWASYMAYQAWQDNFNDKKNSLVQQLLAIRLAWEWVLWQHHQTCHKLSFMPLSAQFLAQFANLTATIDQQQTQQQPLWVWQRALEISYQSELNQKLTAQIVQQHGDELHNENGDSQQAPLMQAAFCIDVRSEPMRRALEEQHKDIETLGFAGFFGLPIDLAFSDSQYRRPQLPGLLAPAIEVKQQAQSPNSKKTTKHLHSTQQQKNAFDSAPASLGLVEMFGILKMGELIKHNFWPAKPQHAINDLCDDSVFTLSQNGLELSLTQKAALAYGVLKNLGLTKNFAETVLLLGHGSCTANNPQAAGLNCGACGGQTGEVNVKVLAQLLNDQDIRTALVDQGITVPKHTHFYPGLHNTTTDEITLYGKKPNQNGLHWLAMATELAQANRAATFLTLSSPELPLPSTPEKQHALSTKDKKKIASFYTQRSQDWAEVRPEWGLANNAAFIVAPRKITRQLDLQGRSFLHDYHWQDDHDFSTLELIMTAPMIVTNWINLQYYASVTDNTLYGSGNKLLHNVVGDHIGVFEGNGGDLRIGLSMQSLHDGKDWRHTPIRLNVYIAAPKDAIAHIVKTHQAVAQLVNNDWLYLFQVEANGDIHQYYQDQWRKA